MSARRLPDGGRIERSRTLRFTWDDRQLPGHPGDTLASALMAAVRAGVSSVSRCRCLSASHSRIEPRLSSASSKLMMTGTTSQDILLMTDRQASSSSLSESGDAVQKSDTRKTRLSRYADLWRA